MDIASIFFDDRYVDPRDDYRNGFVDAVTYLRGQMTPSHEQISDAVTVLTDFRLRQPGWTNRTAEMQLERRTVRTHAAR